VIKTSLAASGEQSQQVSGSQQFARMLCILVSIHRVPACERVPV